MFLFSENAPHTFKAILQLFKASHIKNLEVKDAKIILDLKEALIYPFTIGSHAAPPFHGLFTFSELNYKFCHQIRGGRQGGDGCQTTGGAGEVQILTGNR